MTTKLTLHHLEYSQSFRVLWLLEELAIPYELIVHSRDKKTMAAPDEYKALSPLGTAPVDTRRRACVWPKAAPSWTTFWTKSPGQALRPEPESADRARYLFLVARCARLDDAAAAHERGAHRFAQTLAVFYAALCRDCT